MLEQLNSYKFLRNIKTEDIGYYSFLLGVFFLSSAVGISILLLFFSLIISFLNTKDFLSDKWNYPLFICAFLMILSTINHFLRYEEFINLGIDPKLSLLGLVNWLPFFLCFKGFQNYLNSHKKRFLISKLLICGSIPVIFSGILQILKINGPFELLNGLIVWFQKPLDEVGSLSGLFNNQNYFGLWMVLVWPFCLSELLRPKRKMRYKLTLGVISLLFIIFIILSDSRNAILGLIVSSPIVLGAGNLIWYLPLVFLGFLLLALTVIPIFPNEIRIFMESIIPRRIYTLFPEVGFENISSYPRVSKWIYSLKFISQNPLFGWGAASFPILYEIKNQEWFGHAHNLPFELAISYGILPSLIIFSFYLTLLFLSFKKISILSKNKYRNIDTLLNQKAWFASSLIFFLSHLVDIQYFDVRISTFCWISLAGLRCSLKEKV